MSTATQGRAREHKVREDLVARDWVTIFRSAGSKGPADIGLAHRDHGLALIQVGTENKTLGPADRTRLLNAAWLCSALPIVANVIAQPGRRTVINYWHVNDGPPSTWEKWTP